MSDLKLYEISQEISDVINAEEFDDQRMDELMVSFETKAAAIVHSIANMQGFVDMCKAEEKRIADRRKAAENRIESVKAYLKTNMEQNDFTELPIGTQKVSLQNSPPKLIVEDESKIPAKYFTIIPEQKVVDKKAILKDIKTQAIDGCRTEQGTHLRIR